MCMTLQKNAFRKHQKTLQNMRLENTKKNKNIAITVCVYKLNYYFVVCYSLCTPITICSTGIYYSTNGLSLYNGDLFSVGP